MKKKLLLKTVIVRCLLGCLAAVVACSITAVASAQTRTLRVVTYNIQDDVSYGSTPLAGLICPFSGTGTFTTSCSGSVTNGGVLEGIGEEIVNGDPAQPIDILALQETTSNGTTVQPILDGLNAFYSSRGISAGYAMSPLQLTATGGSGGGPNAVVYNTNTVQLLGSVGVGTPSDSGIARQVGRYLFAPAGVATNASNVFYVYVSHYKSGTDSDSVNRRTIEAGIIRTNSAVLPANSRVLYVGDYNISTSTETSYQDIVSNTLISYGIQGFDPFNPSGATGVNWTQNSMLNEKTESCRSLHYRDDFQVMSSNVYYSVAGGLAYVTNTYHTFGNNGSSPYEGAIISGNTALNNDLESSPPISAAQCYTNLYGGSDHLPVVADYTIPIPLIAPVASFTASPTNGAAPLSVSFTDTSSGSITGWAWAFGDGNTSRSQNPTNIYVTPGTYTVQEIVSGLGGVSTNVQSNYIVVNCETYNTTSSSPAGGGSTSGGGTVPCGSNVTVCATPNACYSFVNWTDQNSNVVSTSECYGFTAAGNETLVANFAVNGGPISGSLTNLWSFTGGSDGAYPVASLVQGSDGNFYGTTAYDGASGNGTVFRISPSGSLMNLWSFTNGLDGANPYAGLVQGSDSNFYGTTSGSGAGPSGYGTVFRISPGGSLTNLWSFTGGSDGAWPLASLVQASDGNFYGTTSGGVANGNGTVFRISPGGTYTTLYSFGSSANDGANPYAGLVQGSDGNFYGTTSGGGASGNGTVFRISPGGSLTNLWQFTGSSDGAYPLASLVQGSDGNFYGATSGGGTSGNGTVFRISPSGDLTNLWEFTGCSDGAYPLASLVQGSDGNFYGTTSGSGSGFSANGTVFQISPSGSLTTLWLFTNGVDGAGPYAGLVQGIDGSFYGTTAGSGSGPSGNGTVFKVTPPPPPVASFTATPTSGAAPLSVNFTDASTGSVTGWAWAFGDGNTSTSQNPSDIYTNPGSYTVQEVVTGSGGSSTNTPTALISVYAPFAWWQLNYFGSTNNPNAAPSGDYTGTGMSNTNKFLAGFNPTNSAAYLHIISIAGQLVGGNSNVVVTYLGANGDNTYTPGIGFRTNVLDYTVGDASGNYASGGWQDTGQTNILGGGNGSGIVTNMTDTAVPADTGARYYRVRVLLP